MEAIVENPIVGMDAIPLETVTTNGSNAEQTPDVNTTKFHEIEQLPALENTTQNSSIIESEADSFDMSAFVLTPNTGDETTLAHQTTDVSESIQESVNVDPVPDTPAIPRIEEVVFDEPRESIETSEPLGIESDPIVDEPQDVNPSLAESSSSVEQVIIEEVSDDQSVNSSMEKSEQTVDMSEPDKLEHVEIQIDESSSASVESEEMILEETTGEYVKKIKSPVVKRKKLEVDEKYMARVIEESYRAKELKPGEQIVIVTEDEEGNTHQMVFTHSQTTVEDGVTIQHVVDESGDVYMIETVDEDDDDEEEEVQEDTAKEPKKKTPLKRGRKTSDIPNHVLGRNIENPAIDTSRNGKPPPKPRLGVKVPYRNLTSQMVTKQEIAEEVFQRSRRFGKTCGQNLFAQKLSSNLAKKLNQRERKILAVSKGTRSMTALKKIELSTTSKLNNSELLAILEGDAEKKAETKDDDGDDEKPIITPEMERELALKQLSELPDDEPPKLDEERPTQTPVTDPKTRFSSDVPIKTYSRKRKPSNELLIQYSSNPKHPPSKQESPPSKSTAKSSTLQPPAADASNYVTKSSRVIKRKVIWDPDETSPKKGVKSEPTKTDHKLSADTKDANKKDAEIKKDNKNDAKKENTKTEAKKEVVKTETKKVIKSPVAVKITRSQKKISEEMAAEEQEEVAKESKSDAGKSATPLKRRRNEISKLLMDEGAVNMLYSIKTEEATSTRAAANKSLQLKTDELLSDLQSTTGRASPKALRKKDATPVPVAKSSSKLMCPPTPSPIARQKSKDSTRSSVHSPPASPGQSFGGSESRIIRRHSSSSYSSMGEEDDGDEKKGKKFGRKRSDAMVSPESPKKKMTRSKNDNFQKLVENKLVLSTKYNNYNTFNVKELNKMIQIELEAADDTEDQIYVTNEVMSNLRALLAELEQDANVNVVLIVSNGSAFCNGIHYKSLVSAKESTKKSAAKKLATNIKEFLLCLAKFPKVLIAGVHAESIGIGVTMLPLFDMIIAEEEAKFTIPNAKFGCIAEGGSLLLLPHLSRNVLVNELLYSSQTLSADDALKLGLVTKILSKDAYSKELINTSKNVSDKSAQFMVATKKQIRQRMLDDITRSLNDDTDSVLEQWLSAECQKSFAEIYM